MAWILLLCMAGSTVAQAPECPATAAGSVSNFTTFPPHYLSVTGSWTPILARSCDCPGACVFEWRVVLTIRSPGTGTGPTLELCASTNPMSPTCGKFYLPGSIDGSGDYVQQVNETFSFAVNCGLTLTVTLDIVELLGHLNIVSVAMTCGGSCD
jgi:hypothetical protein